MNTVIRAKFAAPLTRNRVDCDAVAREWIDFVHGCNELVTVVGGALEITVGGETCTVGPGDEVFIPRGTLHSVRNIHDATTRWLYGYD